MGKLSETAITLEQKHRSHGEKRGGAGVGVGGSFHSGDGGEWTLFLPSLLLQWSFCAPLCGSSLTLLTQKFLLFIALLFSEFPHPSSEPELCLNCLSQKSDALITNINIVKLNVFIVIKMTISNRTSWLCFLWVNKHYLECSKHLQVYKSQNISWWIPKGALATRGKTKAEWIRAAGAVFQISSWSKWGWLDFGI